VKLNTAIDLALKVRRSSKFNRKIKVLGIVGGSRGYHVTCVDKESGRPFHFGYEHKSPRNDRLTDKEIAQLHKERP
jgi:hypothetical protein